MAKTFSSMNVARSHVAEGLRGSIASEVSMQVCFRALWGCSEHKIAESILGNLERSLSALPSVPHFVFITKGCGEVYMGFGHSENVGGGVRFVACMFEDDASPQYVSPLVLLSSSRSEWPLMKLSVNCASSIEAQTALSILDALDGSFESGDNFAALIAPCVSSLDVGMSRSEYAAAVASALEEMESGDLDKVVYARCVEYTMAASVSAAVLLHKLVQETEFSDGKNRYIVLFNPTGGEGTFVSVTPERLCRIEQVVGDHDNSVKCKFYTEALAGTFAINQQSDAKIGAEHEKVSDYVFDKLGQLTDQIKVLPTEQLLLKEMVHLRQRFEAIISDNTDVSSLCEWGLSELSPTPAVCGFPLHRAKKLIHQNEKFARYFFASPIGIITNACADVAVGLRSAWVCGRRILVYAGAGLVSGSNWESEWAEMDLKMNQYNRILMGTSSLNEIFPRQATRPVFFLDDLTNAFPCNHSEAQSAFVIEELVRQGVHLFVICPGSRNSPLTVAVHRNAATTPYVIHDERSAGFYALGIAKANKRVAVIVSSGTAVSNLMPAVSEAREAGLGFIIISADRPSASWDVGENQTIKQANMFTECCGFVKSYPPPPAVGGSLDSLLADVSFAVGEIMVNRGLMVHFNFEFVRPELQPSELESGFKNMYVGKFVSKKIARYIKSTGRFVSHVNANVMGSTPPKFLIESILNGSAIIVCGELRRLSESDRLQAFCDAYCVPCVADVASLLTPASPHVFLGCDQLFGHDSFKQKMGENVKVVIRLGGQLIGAKTHEWCTTAAPVTVRVHCDQFRRTRHDPAHVADLYFHCGLNSWLDLLEQRLSSTGDGCSERNQPFPALSHIIRAEYAARLSDSTNLFTEMQIAKIIGEQTNVCFYLSASMPCRDFDLFGWTGHRADLAARYVGANRGANGIDGVIASALGYSKGHNQRCIVLIGDVAALYDIGSVALLLNEHPGNRKSDPLGDVIVVCPNNDGSAIFSFLPIRAFDQDYHPYFDTPHQLRLENIVNGFREGTAVSASSAGDLRSALCNAGVRFVECVGIPGHDENVKIHKELGARVLDAIKTRW